MNNHITATPSRCALHPAHPRHTDAPGLAATLARHLEVLAGCELQHGHHAAAEHLSRQAAAMREAAR